MDILFQAIDIERIFSLPLVVKGPGLLLIGLFLIRAIRCLFSLRLITLFTSLVYAIVIAAVLSSAGDSIAYWLELQKEPAKDALLQLANRISQFV